MTYEEQKIIEDNLRKAPKEHPDFGRICNCLCHVDKQNMYCSCFVDCCGRSHKKYFNEEGVFDIFRFGELVMNERLRKKGKG